MRKTKTRTDKRLEQFAEDLNKFVAAENRRFLNRITAKEIAKAEEKGRTKGNRIIK